MQQPKPLTFWSSQIQWPSPSPTLAPHSHDPALIESLLSSHGFTLSAFWTQEVSSYCSWASSKASVPLLFLVLSISLLPPLLLIQLRRHCTSFRSLYFNVLACHSSYFVCLAKSQPWINLVIGLLKSCLSHWWFWWLLHSQVCSCHSSLTASNSTLVFSVFTLNVDSIFSDSMIGHPCY